MSFLFLIGTIISFILAGYIIWIHGIKPKITNVESSDFDKFRNEVSKLITEFNRVANVNINILEDKIEDLKNVIRLADDKIIKINSKLTDLEILANRNKEPVATEVKKEKVEIPEVPTMQIKEKVETPKVPAQIKKIKPLPKKATVEEKREKIKELVDTGFSVEEIAKAVNMSKGEVQLVLELKKKDRTVK